MGEISTNTTNAELVIELVKQNKLLKKQLMQEMVSKYEIEREDFIDIYTNNAFSRSDLINLFACGITLEEITKFLKEFQYEHKAKKVKETE